MPETFATARMCEQKACECGKRNIPEHKGSVFVSSCPEECQTFCTIGGLCTNLPMLKAI